MSAPVGISLDNWLTPPYAKWSFQHVEDFVPTAVISRGSGPVAELPTAGAPLADIPVSSVGGVASTVGAVMTATATDGWAVAHRGSIVTEEYLDDMRAATRHLLFSVSKSLVAAVVGALHDATGSWTPALVVVITLQLLLVAVGAFAGRARVIG